MYKLSDIVEIPVGCLAWTQNSINSNLAFGSCARAGHSIEKLFDELMRGQKGPCDIDAPLDVVAERRGDTIKLWSESNRRLLALVAYQSTRRDTYILATGVPSPSS